MVQWAEVSLIGPTFQRGLADLYAPLPVPLSRSTYLVTEVSAGQLNEQGLPQRQICQDHDFKAAELYQKVEYLESCGVVLVS